MFHSLPKYEIMLQTYAQLISPLLATVIEQGKRNAQNVPAWESNFARFKEASAVDEPLSFQILDICELPLKRKRNKVGITKGQKNYSFRLNYVSQQRLYIRNH